MFEREARIMQRMFPQYKIDLGGLWGTPRVIIESFGLVISLDQMTPCIHYSGRAPAGYSRRFYRDPDSVFRLNVARDGTVAANIYGLLCTADSLPDLYHDADKSGAIQVAVALFDVPCHVEGHKWFLLPDTFATETLCQTTPQEHEEFYNALISLRNYLLTRAARAAS